MVLVMNSIVFDAALWLTPGSFCVVVIDLIKIMLQRWRKHEKEKSDPVFRDILFVCFNLPAVRCLFFVR